MTDKGDENTNATRLLRVMRVDGVCDEHSRDDLVSGGSNTNTDERCNVPFGTGLLKTDEEDDEADYREDITGIGEPQTVFGGRTATHLTCANVHPGVGQDAPDLLAND